MNELYRIIDANLNRASEGMRVMEDLARFSLESHTLSARLKSQRHALRSGIDSMGLEQIDLLRFRDTAHDVGTDIQTLSESERTRGSVDIASAAAKRTQEALRSIEESFKGLGLSGSVFESIRYAIYDIERDLTLELSKPSAAWSICVLVSRNLCTHKSPIDIVHDIARAGAPCIQIREKELAERDLLDHCQEMTAAGHDLGLKVIINDRVDIAQACNADGVHLGQDDLPVSVARSILGPTKLIGRSCSTVNQLREAFSQSADYCGLGPIFPSTTKVKPNLLGVQTLAEVMEQEDLKDKPMLAISGINELTIDQVISTKFPGIAVSSAVCSSVDPYKTCNLFVNKMLGRESCSV